MTITKSIAAKLAVAFVAVAMVFSAFATSAKAQTTEDLQQMINDLLAQVAALQAQTGQGASSAAGVCPYTWTRDLSSGSTGADVMKLQQFLNADPDTRVAVEGAGSAGSETEYYGPATAAAVSKLQVKYRSEILSPANLVNPTGYFGPSTRAKANSLCVSAPADDMMDDSSDDMMDDSDDDDNGPVSLSGEASLDKVEIDSPADDTIEEGAEDAEIAEVTVEFADGDAEISRIDVQLLVDGETDTDTARPWDAFDTVSLWVDGDKVAEESADNKDDYLNDNLGTLRFSGLDIVAMEDEEVEIVVAASVQNGLDAEELDTWEVYVTAMRFFDADGVASTEDNVGDMGDEDALSGAANSSFTLEEEGTDDELIVKTSSNDPDGTTLQLEDDSKSDWYTVFVFDLDTDDSVNDIELNEVTVSVTLSSSTYAAIIDDAELVIDGVTIDDFTASTTLAGSADLVFDVDGDVVIDAGDRVSAELNLRFKSLSLPGNEGMTVQAEVTAADANAIDAAGADDLSASSPDQLRGAAQGEVHTLRTAGVDVSLESTDADVTVGDSTGDDYATYVIELEVTAFEQDVYISTNPATALDYDIETSSGSTTAVETVSAVLESTGDEVSGAFEITEGATETITITVTYNPAAANTSARLDLDSIVFGSEPGTPTGQTWTASPTETYRTKVVTMVD